MLLWGFAHAQAQTGTVIDLVMAARMPVVAGIPWGPEEQVMLSDAWNAQQRFGTWRYTLLFPGPASTETWGLFIPRVGNRAHIEFNGQTLEGGKLGHLNSDDRTDHAQRPHYVALPGLKRQGQGFNELAITVEGERARYAGLSRMQAGLTEDVHTAFRMRELIQTQGTVVMIAISALLTLFAGGVAWQFRDGLSAWFAAACALVAFRNLSFVITQPPVDHRLWALLLDSAYVGYVVCISWFCLHAQDIHHQWLRWPTRLFIGIASVTIPLHAWGRYEWARQLTTSAMLTFAVCMAACVIWHSVKRPSTTGKVLGWAALAAVSIGAYDHYLVFYSADRYANFALARYSVLFFLVAMAWVLFERMKAHHQQEQAFHLELASQLSQRTVELNELFRQQAARIENEAHEKERARLLHDLHDGMGLQLNTLLLMAQQQQHPSLVTEIRQTIDQMRMLVDNSQTFDGTLAELLGHIRHRIESRLARQGIHLAWHMNPDETDRPVQGDKAVALQHLIFEVSTNVIKHAHATQLLIDVRQDNVDHVVLTMQDNGKGFDVQQPRHGLGLQSIQKRVQHLQGELTLHTAAGAGTRYVMRFPFPSHTGEVF